MPNSSNEEKSLSRSKKSAISLSEMLGKEALNSVIPGAGVVYTLTKILLTHAKDFYKDRTETRIAEFHNALLYGTEDKDLNVLMNASFSLEDYYSLLSNVVQDEEDGKIAIYSKLFQAVLNRKLSEKYKLHFIKSLREFTLYDIQLIQEIYIRTHYEFKRGPGKEQQVTDFTTTDDPMKNCSIQRLLNHGFLLTKEYDKIVFGEQKEKIGFKASDMLNDFSVTIFDADALTPEAIGQEAWLEIPIVHLMTTSIEVYKNSLLKVSEILTELNIRSSTHIPKPTSILGTPHYPTYDIVFLFLGLQETVEDVMSAFAEQNSKRKSKIIKVLVSESSTVTPHDPLPNIECIATIHLSPKNTNAINDLKDLMMRLADEYSK